MVNFFNVKTTTTKLCVRRRGSYSGDYGYLKRVKCSDHSVHFAFGFVVLLFECALFGFAYWTDMSLPSPIMRSDEVNNPTNIFVAERAKEHLKVLTDIGPKVTGSESNEVKAVQYIQNDIGKIIKTSTLQIEIDTQKASGSYFYDYKPYGMTNVYDNIQNIVVKVHADSASTDSLLVNCHFDTVANSPGGTDDGISCATMLEVLRVISLDGGKRLNNLIFLFNGAEENPLQGSHAFITQHKWKEEVRTVINLDSVGAGGRELLFQVGPGEPWLMNYYRQVPHPHAQVAGEEVFQSNLVPSDTDMRVFKKFSNLKGLDIAFTQNGYVYHTKFDNMDAIEDGTYQHVGDNLLSLVRSLSNAPELGNGRAEDGNSVYYDVFGLFLIDYTETIGTIINSVTIVISYIMFIVGMKDVNFNIFGRHFMLSIVAMLLGWTISVCLGLFTGVLLDWWNSSMSWFGKQWLIFGLYTFPTVGILSLFLVLINQLKEQKKLCLLGRTHTQIHTNRFIWTTLLLILTSIGIRSSYILMVPILFNSVIYVIIFLLKLNGSEMTWCIVYLIGMIIPSLLNLYQIRITLALFLPIFGRSGSDQNPEILASILSVTFTIIVASFYVPLVSLIRKQYYFVIGIFIVFVITIIVAVTPAGFPYSGNVNSPRPQRFQVWHTSRTFYDENQTLQKSDSGYLILNMDRNSPRSIKDDVKAIQSAESLANNCESQVYCGVPVYESGQLLKIKESSWIPAEMPKLRIPTILKLQEKLDGAETVRFTFSMSGPSHLALFLSPRATCLLSAWSIESEIPEVEYIVDNRTTYFIAFGSGNADSSYEVYFDIHKTDACLKEPYMFDIVISGKFLDSTTNENTEQFMEFLNQFPEWAHVISWTATYQSYKF